VSITKKIFVLTFCVASLAVAIIAVTTLGIGKGALRELGRSRLVESVEREAHMLQTRLDMLRDDIIISAGQDTLRRLSIGAGAESQEFYFAIIRHFRMMMEKRPDYAEVAILQDSDHGTLILRVRRETDGLVSDIIRDQDLTAQYPVYPTLLGLWPGSVHFSPIELASTTPLDSGPAVHVSHAGTRLPEWARKAVFLVTLDVDSFVAGLGAGSDIGFFVADREGLYLAFSKVQSAKIRPGNLLDEYGLRQIWADWLAKSDNSFFTELSERGQGLALNRVMVGDPMDALGIRHIIVGGQASLADVEMEVLTFRNQLVGFSIGLGVLLALTLALAVTYLTRPLVALTKVAERIAEGHQDVTFPPAKPDEIGQLADVMRRMLDALKASAKNEEQAALGRMATMVAHDVRNALSSVKMNLRILADRRPPDDDCESCSIALGQVAYMENVLDDMLAFAKPDKLRLDWLEIVEVIEIATLSLSQEIQSKKINMRNLDESTVDCLPRLLGDRTKLIRTLQNLINNAVQAVALGGTVTINARSVLYQSMPAVEVVIVDNGEGLPPGAAEHVFEPFFTTRAKGTGLGLAIVQRIVRAHGGTVTLSPSANGGAEVYLILPLTPPDLVT
jgi:signal transduction histidine kinase